MKEPAVIIVTENNVPKNVILVPDGHNLAEKVFKELCEDTFKYTPTDEDFDNGYVEKAEIDMSVAICWPEVRE